MTSILGKSKNRYRNGETFGYIKTIITGQNTLMFCYRSVVKNTVQVWTPCIIYIFNSFQSTLVKTALKTS